MTKHRWHNPEMQRSLDKLGLVALDSGDYMLGARCVTLSTAIVLVDLLTAGVRLEDADQARAFVLGLNAEEVERILAACLERSRP